MEERLRLVLLVVACGCGAAELPSPDEGPIVVRWMKGSSGEVTWSRTVRIAEDACLHETMDSVAGLPSTRLARPLYDVIRGSEAARDFRPVDAEGWDEAPAFGGCTDPHQGRAVQVSVGDRRFEARYTVRMVQGGGFTRGDEAVEERVNDLFERLEALAVPETWPPDGHGCPSFRPGSLRH